MKSARQGYTLARIALAWLALAACAVAQGQQADQDAVTAALALQLLSFTEWPATDGGAAPGQDGAARAGAERRGPDDGAPISIGIFEDERLLGAFAALIERPPFRGRFGVALVTSETPARELARLDALFFPSAEPRAAPHIIKRLEGQPVALLGSFDGFLEMGGMVNFIKRQRKLAFEIDLARSRASGIEYRSKLLRLASRIIGQ